MHIALIYQISSLMKVTLRLIILVLVSFQLSSCFMYPRFSYRRQPRDFEDNKGSGELGLSYGRVSGTQVLNAFGNSGDLHYTSSSSSGNIFATYHYFLSDGFCIGASIGTQSLHYNWQNDNNGASYQEKLNLTTAALEMKAIIADTRNTQFYALWGLAATDRSDQIYKVAPTPAYAPAVKSGMIWNIQLSYGIRFGGTFGGFAEVGIGYKGIINGGVYYMLPGMRGGKRHH